MLKKCQLVGKEPQKGQRFVIPTKVGIHRLFELADIKGKSPEPGFRRGEGA